MCTHQEKAMQGHSEKAATHKPGSGLLPGTKSASTLILESPASRTKKKHACCLSYPVYAILLEQPELTKTVISLEVWINSEMGVSTKAN